MGDIAKFKGVTKLNINPDWPLEEAVGELSDSVVLGWKKDGDFYFASSVASGPEVVWLLELAKQKLLEPQE